MLALAPPLTMVVRVLRPAIALLNWIANRTLRAVGVEPQDEVTSAFTRDEVAGLVGESRREGKLDSREERLLIGALEFEERDARSVLLPLADVETVPIDVTPAEVEAIAGPHRLLALPGRRATSELVGYLHLKDALEIEDRHRNRPIARSWVRPLAVVDATDRLRAVLADDAALQRPPRPRRGRGRRRRSASPRSRTCSRSSSARSATSRNDSPPEHRAARS